MYEPVIDAAEILNEEQMVAVLVDIHFIEADLYIKQNTGKDVKYYTKLYYSYFSKKYNLTYNQFTANIQYYASHMKEFERIYEQVLNTISQKNGEIFKQ